MIDWEEVRFYSGVVAILVCVLLAVVGALVVIQRVGAEADFVGKSAAIEQLRHDLAKADYGKNEFVIGQATKWNQDIRENKEYRKHWWGRLVVPAGWENVKEIGVK